MRDRCRLAAEEGQLAFGMCSPFSTLQVNVHGPPEVGTEDRVLGVPLDRGVKDEDIGAGSPGGDLVALLPGVVMGVGTDPSLPCTWNETVIVAGDPSWPRTGLPSMRRT